MSAQEIIDAYLSSSVDITKLLDEQTAILDELHLALTDVDHYLELEDLSDEKLLKLVQYRKGILKARRQAKDMIRVIDQILPKQIEGRTTQDRYEFAVRQLSGRVYSPRAITLEQVMGED